MKIYRLMSIDQSTRKTGCALFENGKLIDYCLIDKSKNKDSSSRLNDMCVDILNKIKEWHPDGLVCEHPQGDGRNVLVVYLISQIIGVVRAYSIENGCDFKDIMPSEWRKRLGWKQGKLKRDALKEMSLQYVKEKFNIEVQEDVADAICIGQSVFN